MTNSAGNNYFKQAGDLKEDYFTAFKNPGDLVDYFKPAGDMDDEKSSTLGNNNIDNSNLTKVEIDDYLLTVVSGKKYPYESEMGKVIGAASTVVNLEEVKRMVDEGYNIVSAECINSDMIIVEFQCFDKNNDKGRGR